MVSALQSSVDLIQLEHLMNCPSTVKYLCTEGSDVQRETFHERKESGGRQLWNSLGSTKMTVEVEPFQEKNDGFDKAKTDTKDLMLSENAKLQEEMNPSTLTGLSEGLTIESIGNQESIRYLENATSSLEHIFLMTGRNLETNLETNQSEKNTLERKPIEESSRESHGETFAPTDFVYSQYHLMPSSFVKNVSNSAVPNTFPAKTSQSELLLNMIDSINLNAIERRNLWSFSEGTLPYSQWFTPVFPSTKTLNWGQQDSAALMSANQQDMMKGNFNDLYKTELCRSFMETGFCRYNTKCQFAHGLQELRPVKRHPKYKTRLCKNFVENGTCPYGSRCRFIHGTSSSSFEGLETDLLLAVEGIPQAKDKRRRLPVFQTLEKNRLPTDPQ